MKKANFLITLLSMLAFLLSGTATAHDFKVDGIYYKINGNEATVTYRGSSSSQYSNEYSGSIVIPETVIYNGVTYSVTSIDNAAFEYCRGLTSIVIPSSVISIGEDAFFCCSSLVSVTIPNSVIAIGGWAFYGTPWFDNQPDGLVYAGLVAYEYKGNTPSTSISLKEGTLGIASWAFTNGNITGIEIPSSVILIGDCAFSCCNLKSIEIPNSVISIGNEAFSSCLSLRNVEIGNSVTNIGEQAFANCSNVTNIYCYAPIPPVCDDNTFSNYSVSLHVPATSLASYFIAPCWRNFESIIGDAIAPTGITISEDSAMVDLGEQFNLTATVIPANASNKRITWMSTNTNVATVYNGSVMPVGYGECDIIASCFGMRVSCHLMVGPKEIITLDQQEAKVLPNHIIIITPSASPIMPEGFTVTSSDITVAAARVMNGVIQIVGIKEGTTIITVGSADGLAIPATCLVTVYTEPGDLNSDGFVNISDVTSLIDYLLGGDETSVTMKNADVNGDGIINIADVTSLIDTLLGQTE